MALPQAQQLIRESGPSKAVAPPRYEYLSGEILTMDGTSVAGSLPPGTDTLYFRSRAGDSFWNINIGFANGENSAGFTPENWVEVIGPFADLVSVHFYGAAGAFIHIHYLKEVW